MREQNQTGPVERYEYSGTEIVWLLLFVMLLFIGVAPLFSALGRWAMIPMQILVLAGPPVVYVYTRTGSVSATLPALGLRRVNDKAWLGAILIGISFWMMSVWLIIPIVERFTDMREAERELREILALDRTPLIVTLLTVAALPAVCEEVLLRGVVARGLRSSIGFIGALVVSAVLFGLMHLDMVRLAPMIAFGLVLGFVALTSDSCLPTMLIHFLNNAIVLAGDRIPGLNRGITSHPHIAGAIATVICVTGLIISWWARLDPINDHNRSESRRD